MNPRFAVSAPVCTTAQIRDIELRAAKSLQGASLMERAGLAAAEIARGMASSGGRVLIMAGPGNNGGDAFVVARHLKAWWFNVEVVFDAGITKLPADAAGAYAAWKQSGGATLDTIPVGRHWDLVVDGLFGIGLQREISGEYASRITSINAAHAPILALDIPSGLASDTGRVMGTAIRADRTCTFIALKPGLLTADGLDYCGAVDVCDLGLPVSMLEDARGRVVGRDVLNYLLPSRRANSHKGSYGSAGIIGGSPGMAGAALLSARAALMLGAGRVYAGLLDTSLSVDTRHPELMLRDAAAVLAMDHLNVVAAGPGLSLSVDAAQVLAAALVKPVPLVLDADALNLIAMNSPLKNKLRARTAATLLTPHPAEAARLLDVSTSAIQSDRIASASRLAASLNAHVLLKGAGTVCATPDGRWFINGSGNPGMASAGMGDVLTGLIAALLAQGVEAELALRGGAYLHGAAADALLAQGIGPVGMTASEVTTAARSLINQVRSRVSA